MKTSQSNAYEAVLIEQMHAFDQKIIEPESDTDRVRPHEIWNGADPDGEEPVWGIIYGERFRNKRVELTCADFAQGTIRVLVPCKLVLCEDIEFNPNPDIRKKGKLTEKPWFPRSDQLAYLPFARTTCEGGAAAIQGAEAASQHSQETAPSLPKALAPSSGFVLGFFAAITVEHCEGTIIDLNGYRLACHEHFALQQRFHALIELANQPFIPDQGPTAFGPNLRPARKVWIRNGEIGRSAHHGIHGNSMQDVLITDVTFRDYEVAAISLNGGRRIVIQDCQLEGTFTRVPVIGTYSAGRFACLMGRRTLARAAQSGLREKDEYCRLDESLKNLEKCLDGIFKVITNPAPELNSKAKAEQVDPFFANIDPATGELGWLPDGNPYGIALHARGVLVNAFVCASSKMGGIGDMSKALECTDVSLQRVNIARTIGNVHEVLAFAYADLPPSADQDARADSCCEQAGEALNWRVVADAAGAVVRFFPMDSQLHPYWHGRKASDLAEMDEDGKPSLTVLGKVQFAIAAMEDAMGIEQKDASAGNLYGLINWAFPKTEAKNQKRSKNQRIVPARPGEFPVTGGWRNPEQDPSNAGLSGSGLYKLVAEGSEEPLAWLRLRGNGDTMHHVNKGALAVFIQAVDGLCLNRVVVAGVRNVGLPGSLKAGPYQGPDDGGHGAQAQQEGYNGADAFGIYLGACSNVAVDRVQAHGIQSDYGKATGIALAGGTEHAAVLSAVTGNVTAGQAYRLPGERSCKPDVPLSRFPNAAPVGIGLHVDNTTRNIQIDDFQQVGKLTQPSRNHASKILIESRLNLLNG